MFAAGKEINHSPGSKNVDIMQMATEMAGSPERARYWSGRPLPELDGVQ